MQWINIKDHYPPQIPILVYATCGMPHVAIFDYDDYYHTEHCYEAGHHFPGSPINFTHWMPLPEAPSQKNPKDLVKLIEGWIEEDEKE